MLEPARIFHPSRQERGALSLEPAHVELLNLRRRSCEPTPEKLQQISIILLCTNLRGCHVGGHRSLFSIISPHSCSLFPALYSGAKKPQIVIPSKRLQLFISIFVCLLICFVWNHSLQF